MNHTRVIPMLRAQYYFRQSGQGLLARDVRELVELARDLPVEEVQLSDIAELDETHWYNHEGASHLPVIARTHADNR